jgi:hypothetical protein
MLASSGLVNSSDTVMVDKEVGRQVDVADGYWRI